IYLVRKSFVCPDIVVLNEGNIIRMERSIAVQHFERAHSRDLFEIDDRLRDYASARTSAALHGARTGFDTDRFGENVRMIGDATSSTSIQSSSRRRSLEGSSTASRVRPTKLRTTPLQNPTTENFISDLLLSDAKRFCGPRYAAVSVSQLNDY